MHAQIVLHSLLGEVAPAQERVGFGKTWILLSRAIQKVGPKEADPEFWRGPKRVRASEPL